MSAAVAITAAAAAIGGAYSIHNAERQRSAQNKAQEQAQANADKQLAQAEQLADRQMNQQNQKRPNTAGALSAAQQAAKGGASGTMLTGPQGIDPSQLTLGRNTLLGQ